MRVSVAEFLQIVDVQILIEAGTNHDGFLYVLPRGDRIDRARDGHAIKKLAKANGLVAEWSKVQQAWCIQIMSPREKAEAGK